MLAACAAGGAAATPSPVPTVTPTVPPTPRPALDPNAFWVAADGPADSVLTVSPQGKEVTRVRLPLNEGQLASDIVASKDGRGIAYLVWDENSQQRGIAAWTLDQPNARLIAQPLPGYRIISLYLTDDASTVLFVQVESPGLPGDVAWRLESVPAHGGDPALLADRESAPDLLPPIPFAWVPNGSMFMNAAVRGAQQESDDVLQGIYAMEPGIGTDALVTPPEDRIVTGGTLSPDGTRLLYITYGGPLPWEGEGTEVYSVARILDLSTAETITIDVPEGGTAVSAAWMGSSEYVLFDYLMDWGQESESQVWARVEAGRAAPWPQTAPDPTRERLFTYLPYRDGVAYTLYPAANDDPWELRWMPEVSEDVVPVVVSLGRLAEGGPRVVRVP